ncbi:hypothetical protein QBC32DRAFT_342239, partial [Pseudoneurospora amorphoporcata]
MSHKRHGTSMTGPVVPSRAYFFLSIFFYISFLEAAPSIIQRTKGESMVFTDIPRGIYSLDTRAFHTMTVGHASFPRFAISSFVLLPRSPPRHHATTPRDCKTV